MEHKVLLTSAEIGYLWANYLGDSMSICVLQYFLKKADDAEIKKVIQYALDISKEHVERISNLYVGEELPIPLGFCENDVNPDAPSLWNDVFFLHYVQQMAKGGLVTYATVLPTTVNEEIRLHFSKCLASATNLFNMSSRVLLAKGIQGRPPCIPYPKEITFVKSQSFLSGWLGEQRPLTAIEISNLYYNIQTNNLGNTLIMGFAQVAKNKELKKYFIRGKEISKKHIEVLREFLKASDLPSPTTWDQDTSESMTSPFSDRLMLYHINLVTALGMGNYGLSITQSPRRDIATVYARLIMEIGKFAEDGAEINIENGWMERPPHAIDRYNLYRN